MGNLPVRECVTKVYKAARDGSSDLEDLLKRLKTTEQRKTALETKTKDGSHFVTPLIIAAHNGHLNSVKILLRYGADIEDRGTVKIADEVVKGCTPLWAAAASGHLDVVKLFINKGAFMDLQDEDGDTALHYAVKGGHLKIVSELLALGASQLPNDLGLTPLLYACDECFIEMVEHIINRPECTKEQRIDALELLGATIANNSSGDSKKAFSYMKRGMEERYEDLAHPLLKKKMDPVEAYQNRKESQTLEELALLEGDDHAIGMEGLIIRERILGSDNLANLLKIHYRACVLADSEEYEICCGLWQRALEKKMKSDVAATLGDLTFFTAFFGIMVQKGIHLNPNLIEDFFEALVAASENSRAEHEHEEQEKALYCALYLLMIYIKVKGQNANMTDFLQRFLRLNPRTNDGNTLLHSVAWHETPIFSYGDEEIKDIMQSVCKFPCVETMKLILHAGCDVNAVNTEGNTPLHLAVTFKPADPKEVVILSEMLLLLSVIGADPKLPNKNGQTPLDSCETDEARRILSEKRGLSAMNVDVDDAGKIESGTDKRREEGGSLTGTEKDLNGNAKKETETKEISDIGADPKLVNKNGQTPLDSCEIGKARRILSEKRGLSAMSGDVGDAGKIESGTDKRREEGGFLTGTKKDLNENTQKETETKEISGQLRELTRQLESIQEQLRQKDGQLREVTQQLTNVQGKLQVRDGELRQMTRQLTNVQGQLQERDGELRQVTQQLTNVQGQLQERDGELRQMTQQLTNVQEQLQERDGELSQMTQQLTNVQGQLQERDGELSQMTQQLTDVQGQLQERDGELSQMTQQLTNVQEQLQERDGELRQRTQQFTNVERQLQEKDEENTSLEEQLRVKEQEVNELEITLSIVQQALRGRPRQQSPDWVISRDQIQLTKKCLGKGGWGSVVEGKYCGCTVAVKQIYEVLLNLSPHNRELFEREMSIASKCRHPCLLQFIGATNDEGSPLFVTELMESSLRKLLEQRSLSTTEVAIISLDVARALNYLHQKKPRPIIHRDISSANVLLWRQGDQWRGKVSDYGAANIMQHTMSVCPGAAVYSAPEAFTKNQTVKVDVYSFGVLLCEICIRELPNPDRRDEQIALVTNRVLRALIRGCLLQDPQERPNMEGIIGELEKLV